MTQRMFAFGIVVTAIAWSLVGFGGRPMHTFYVEAASAITLVFVIMGLWLIRREQALMQATEALRTSERRSARKSHMLSVMLENMTQGILLIEPDSRIGMINHRARELLGLPHELISDELTITKLLQWQWDTGEFGDDGSFVETSLRDFLRNGGLANSPPVYVHRRPDGTVLEVRTIMLAGGGAVRTFTDVTETRRAEQQLAAAKEAAEAGYKSKSAFLATMSHEIRTPLNGVVGTASLLLETELSAEQRKSVETIQECSDILLELISDVLDFSKLEAGRMDLESCEFNLFDLCEAVFKILEPRARPKNLVLVFVPSGKPPAKIVSDPARLRQVLLNLIGNAVKFTDAGAVILRVLEAEREGERRIRFEIEDTGIGISEEAKQRLFTEFTQVEASITRRYGGTGLGLAICRKIVMAMGGEIGVESSEGRGSLFWFELPCAESSAAPAPGVAEAQGLRAALIAPDDAGRAAVSDLLGELGVQVQASNEIGDLTRADAVFVHVHHPLAFELICGKLPAGAGDLPFIGYGFGSIAITSGDLRLIDGALTPSAIAHALAAPGLADEAAPQKLVPVAPKRSAARLAILLAEDNAVNQRIAATMLRNMGHTVDIAANGRDALAKAQIRIYDVIIMDMQMPGMDGLEAAGAIRELPGPPGQVPIIAMTANAFAADRSACLEAGMNDFISKPITAQKLFDSIEPWASGITFVRAGESEQPEYVATPSSRAASLSLDHADLIDHQQVRMIEQEVGSAGLHELLVSFWTDAANLLTEMEAAVSAGDLGRVTKILHTLKGSSSNLGLIACGEACNRIRDAIAQGQAPDFDALLVALSKTLQIMQPRATDRRESRPAA